MRSQLAVTLAVVASAALFVASARADEGEPEIKRPPLPEPLLTETVTDLDGTEAGELEIAVNASQLVSRRGGFRNLQTSVEAEWLALRRLGFRFEPAYSRSIAPGAGSQGAFSFGAQASYKLYQDFAHDFHLQVEGGGRVLGPSLLALQPGDPAARFYIDLRSGIRVGRWTARYGVGASAGDVIEHAPVRASLAIMTGFASSERYGFWGVEADADWARKQPIIVAPNVVADPTSLGVPFRIGVAVPLLVGAPAATPSAGIFLRVIFVTDREVSLGETGER